MQIRRLGRTGLKVSEICLGTMTFGHQCDERTSFAILDKVTEAGVTFLDCADCYPVPVTMETVGRSEEILGQWLLKRREKYVLATKCRLQVGEGPNDAGLSRKHILKALDDSLRRLRTDYVDLYQAHSPDPETQLDETLRAMEDLVRSGKVRYIGCSNYPAWQLALALGISATRGWSRFDCVQPRYNLLYREIETELLPLCRDQGIGVIAYNPLAGGFLTGKYRGQSAGVKPQAGRFSLGKEGQTGDLYRERYWQEAQFHIVDELTKFFEARKKPLVQVAIAWMLQQPGITSAIVGATRPEQLDQSLPAVSLKLDDEDKEACDKAWFALPRLRKPSR